MVKNVIPKHLEAISAKLIEMGCEVSEFDDAVRVVGKPRLTHTHVKTLPYPGFPTDMQPQISVALALAAWVLARYFVLRRKLARGRSADLTALQHVFDRAAGGRRTPVVYSNAVASPLVFGFFHPKVVLPAAMLDRQEGTECIMLHELTHVRRRDHIVMQLFTAAAILHLSLIHI